MLFCKLPLFIGGTMKQALTFLIVIFLGSFLLFYGCAPKVIQPEQASTPTSKPKIESEDDRAREAAIMEEELARRQERERLLQQAIKSSLFQDILFDYDSYIIKTENFPKLNDIANWLKKHKDIKIVVEGHCDERGTIEYNLVLGQKRAEAVKDYLVKLGIEEKRIKTISYGKEMPVDPGHTEEAWAKNRRAHFRIE